ncbi:MAG: VanZ family protein [Candidatus Omnitrophota bacterium]
MDHSVKNRRIRAWMPVAVWTFIILIFSVLPGKTLPDVATGHLDKVFHFFVYFLLSILLIRGFRLSFGGIIPLKYILFILILGWGYGILMELVQFAIPGREPSVLDAAANVAGVLFGITLRKLAI